MRILQIAIMAGTVTAIAGCSTSNEGQTAQSATTPSSVENSTFAMEVTDIDYGSVTSDRRFKVSYSFPDDRGRFAVMSVDGSGASEPIADPSEYGSVNDDLAASIVCKNGLRKLQTKPTYVVADRAYQNTYICTNSEG